MKYIKYFASAVFAGMMIAFGGVVYLSCASSGGHILNSVIGSFLFSLGLLTVVARGYDLYTGKIGYITINANAKDNTPTNVAFNLFYYPTIILGNFIGTAIIGYSLRKTRAFENIKVLVENISSAKLHDTPLSIFILACGCGVMMYLAVDGYKKTKNWLFVILPVMVFILCSFEHCVANMFYFCASDCWSKQAVIYTLIMIAGNAVGAIAFHNFKSK